MGQESRQVSPEIPGVAQGGVSQLQRLAGNGTGTGMTRTPVSPWGRRFVNPVGQDENTTLNSLRGLTFGNNPTYAKGNQVLSDTMGGRYLDPASNPYLEGAADTISRRSRKELGQSLDQYDSFANKSGAFASTGASNLRGRAFDDYTNNLTSALTSLYGGNYASERGNQMTAVNQGLNYAGSPFQQSLSLLGAQGLPRQVEDQQLAGEYGDFNRVNTQQQYQNELPFNEQLAILSGMPVSYPQYTPGRSGFQDFGSAAGGLSSLMLPFMMM